MIKFYFALQSAYLVMAVTKDKSLLYKKYPQLASPDTNQCVSALSQLFINLKSI